MALEEILEALDGEAEAERERVERRAQAQAARILEEAKAEAEELKAKEREKALLGLEAQKARILSAAKLEVKRAIAKAKEEIIAQVFEDVNAKLAGLGAQSDYRGVLEKLVQQAVAAANGDSVVVARNEDEALVRELVANIGAGCSVEGGLKGLGGVMVRTAGDSVTIDNSIDSRLEKASRLLRPEVTSTLFG